jgi:hypothetical protein
MPMKAMPKNMAVSTIEPTAEATKGARHQLCRRSQLKSVTSRS